MKFTSLPFTVALAFLTLSGLPAWTQSEAPSEPLHAAFFVEPLVQKGFGGTSYDLSFNYGGGWTGLSRLEFPQVSLEAGAVLGLTLNSETRREWLFEAAFSHSTLAMSGTMNDYDWWEFTGIPKIPWSYTYSTDSTISWHAAVDAAWTLGSTGPWLLALYGTYRFQYTSHVEDGYTGWQYSSPGPSFGPYTLGSAVSSTTDILEYSLTSHTIGLGLMGSLQPSPRFTLELRTAFTPVYAFDRDDHKLRTKLSTAEGWGVGIYADLKAVYRLNRIAKSVIPYLVLNGDINYFVVNTLQTQYWYGNADAGNGAPQGTLITGVGHVITSVQYQVALRFGFSF